MSYVYFISDGLGHVKIGKADDPKQRLKQLQTSNPCELKLLEIIEVEKSKFHNFDAIDFENELHHLFKEHKIRAEWFFEKPVMDYIDKVKHDARYHNRRTVDTYCRTGNFIIYDVNWWKLEPPKLTAGIVGLRYIL